MPRGKNVSAEQIIAKLREAEIALARGKKVLVERWRRTYNMVRPHSSLGYRPPAPEVIEPASIASATPQQTKPAGVETTSTLL